jgi:hypothetical protein
VESVNCAPPCAFDSASRTNIPAESVTGARQMYVRFAVNGRRSACPPAQIRTHVRANHRFVPCAAPVSRLIQARLFLFSPEVLGLLGTIRKTFVPVDPGDIAIPPPGGYSLTLAKMRGVWDVLAAHPTHRPAECRTAGSSVVPRGAVRSLSGTHRQGSWSCPVVAVVDASKGQ